MGSSGSPAFEGCSNGRIIRYLGSLGSWVKVVYPIHATPSALALSPIVESGGGQLSPKVSLSLMPLEALCCFSMSKMTIVRHRTCSFFLPPSKVTGAKAVPSFRPGRCFVNARQKSDKDNVCWCPRGSLMPLKLVYETVGPSGVLDAIFLWGVTFFMLRLLPRGDDELHAVLIDRPAGLSNRLYLYRASPRP